MAVLLPLWALGGTTNSWRVFRALSSGAATGPNLVNNPGMETTGAGLPLAAWRLFGSGYFGSATNAHSGARSLQCSASAPGEVHGGYQTIVLNQTTPKAIKLSGWSKAENVTGSRDSDYSVYLDITYADGTPLWGQVISFSAGTHDWEYRESIILPALPIKQLNCYVLFRNAHAGTVWFDDVSVAEIQDPVVQFDGAVVLSAPPNPLPYNPDSRFTLRSGDGLELQLTQDGGVIEAVIDGTNSLHAPAADYASGWFLCDRRVGSDWWNIGGWVTSSNNTLQQFGVITGLNLSAAVRYSITNNAIRIQATVSNLVASDRAISLYFALPVAIDAGYWWNSPRERVPVSEAVESATLTDIELGARNQLSYYPLATLSDRVALTLALPHDEYRPFRFVYNRATHQFFAAFDLGLSPTPEKYPNTATAELWLYRSDPAWGLRSALAGYYERFPASFARNFTNEGIWVAFADLRGITNISDFGIAYHEIGYSPALVRFDDSHGIQSFRYVSEPWSYWMTMPTNLSNTDYNSVYNYLVSQNAKEVKAATATLSSGLRGQDGRLQFQPAAQPWCPYGAVFSVNPSPFLSDPQYTITKFNNEWNSTVRDVYNHPENGQLDGEYIDSFCASAMAPDFSSNHLRTTSFPLAYTRDNLSPMTPLIYGTYEMSRAIACDVRTMGKSIMANTLFIPWPYLPIGIGLFDFCGTEINCFDRTGNFVPMSDASLLFARALSGRRPYGYLLNTDFTKVTSAEMEAYMRLCAVYAIYPSAFSADASSNNYFEQPALYERDRALFRKYIRIIRALSRAGWQPVTHATVQNSNVGIEAYGTNSIAGTRYLTVRNFASQSVSAIVTLDLAQWAFPGAQWLRLTNLFDGGTLTVDLTGGSNSFPITLPAKDCRAYQVQVSPPPRPAILVDDAGFGFQSNQFGFNVSATPGQTVVIQASSSLTNWTDLQTSPIPDAGLLYFSDPDSASLPRRSYRAKLR